MSLQINGNNISKALNACCKNGALDKASIKEAAAKYGFDAKILDKCNSIFDAEKILKGLIEK